MIGHGDCGLIRIWTIIFRKYSIWRICRRIYSKRRGFGRVSVDLQRTNWHGCAVRNKRIQLHHPRITWLLWVISPVCRILVDGGVSTFGCFGIATCLTSKQWNCNLNYIWCLTCYIFPESKIIYCVQNFIKHREQVNWNIPIYLIALHMSTPLRPLA